MAAWRAVWQGATVVAVTSGANINFDRLRLVSELADIGALREAMLATTIPEQPGAFLRFIQTALDPVPDIQVTEFKYRCASSSLASHDKCGFCFGLHGGLHAQDAVLQSPREGALTCALQTAASRAIG